MKQAEEDLAEENDEVSLDAPELLPCGGDVGK